MRALIVPMLRCPASGESLHLHVESGSDRGVPEGLELTTYDDATAREVLEHSNLAAHLTGDDGRSLQERLMAFDVSSGGLYTADRKNVYPIVAGIPRLLPPELCRHPAEVEHLRRVLSSEGPPVAGGSTLRPEWRGVLEHNIESYSLQWDSFDYTETTWGQSVEHRFQKLRRELGLEEHQQELRGARFVDAACGNGTLALRVAEEGAEVFAFDQSSGVEHARAFAAEKGLPRRGIVHFIQGNLVAPPLARGAFDLLNCGGAVHFTPDVEYTIDQLVALIKPMHSRIYIWTGEWRDSKLFFYNALAWLLRLFPIPLRRIVAAAATLPYMAIQMVLRWFVGAQRRPKVTFHESYVLFLDVASHRVSEMMDVRKFEQVIQRHGFDEQSTTYSAGGKGILAIRR